MGGNILRAPVLPDASVIQNVLALSDERDTWTRRIEAAARDAYMEGYAEGRRVGYLHGVREMETTWPPVVQGLPGPTYAELELLRYPPAGRARFGESVASDRYPALPVEAVA